MPYKREPDPWPWPADTQTERARRACASYQAALRRHMPELCARIDEHMVGVGQTWVVPRIAQYELDELLTPRQAADYCGIRPATLPTWCSRGLVTVETVDGTRYKVSDLIEYQALIRSRRLRGTG